MGDWAAPRELVYGKQLGFTSIATSTSAHTKAANYTEISASTAFDIKSLIVSARNFTNEADFLIDVAIGAAGSEQIIIPNLLHTTKPYTTVWYICKNLFEFPISIPAGTRLSANAQSSYAGANAVNLDTIGFAGGGFVGPYQPTRVINLGADTSDSGGLAVDPGGSAYAKGAWSVLSASLERTIRGFSISIGNRANTARTTAFWWLDIGIGAEGSEVVILENFTLMARDTIDHVSPWYIPTIWIPVPAGTRVVARASCNITDATDRLFDIVLYGIS